MSDTDATLGREYEMIASNQEDEQTGGSQPAPSGGSQPAPSRSSSSSNSSKIQYITVTKIFTIKDEDISDLSVKSQWTNSEDGKKNITAATTGVLTIKKNIILPLDDNKHVVAKDISAKFCCTLSGRQNFSKVIFKNTATDKKATNYGKSCTITKDAVTTTKYAVEVVATDQQQYVCTSCNATGKVKTGDDYKGDLSATLILSEARFQVTFKIPYYMFSTYTETVYASDIESYQATRKSGAFPNKSQVAFIYDKDMNNFLQFDGVIKVQFNNQVGIQDDKSNQKKSQKYKYNCKDQADEITLQVMQSNVYTNSSQFEGNSGIDLEQGGLTRAASTYQYLYDLKQARRVVDVYTTLKFLSNFVVKSITVTLDENNTEGWSGSIVLHEYIDSQDQTSGNSLGGTDKDRNSDLYNLLGQIWGVN